MLLILMHMQNLVKIHLFILKILSGLTSYKGHKSVPNWQKLTLLDVVNINAYVKFVHNPFLHSQDIERKRNSNVIQGPLLCNE